MNEVADVRDEAIGSANEKGRDARMVESRNSLLTDELVSLKRKKSKGCGMEIVGCKVANGKGDVKNLVAVFPRDTFASYASIRLNVVQTLIALCSPLRGLTYHKAQRLQ